MSECARCKKSIPANEHEHCWYCHARLCHACWDAHGHCGHKEAERANAALRVPPITNPARPFRAVQMEHSQGSKYFASAIVGPDDTIEQRSEGDADCLGKATDKLNDLYERGYTAGRAVLP